MFGSQGKSSILLMATADSSCTMKPESFMFVILTSTVKTLKLLSWVILGPLSVPEPITVDYLKWPPLISLKPARKPLPMNPLQPMRRFKISWKATSFRVKNISFMEPRQPSKNNTRTMNFKTASLQFNCIIKPIIQPSLILMAKKSF